MWRICSLALLSGVLAGSNLEHVCRCNADTLSRKVLFYIKYLLTIHTYAALTSIYTAKREVHTSVRFWDLNNAQYHAVL